MARRAREADNTGGKTAIALTRSSVSLQEFYVGDVRHVQEKSAAPHETGVTNFPGVRVSGGRMADRGLTRRNERGVGPWKVPERRGCRRSGWRRGCGR